eukprot:jgi/Botrbrau1/7872/Bobra.9_2s0048.1
MDVDLYSSSMKNITSLTYIEVHKPRGPLVLVGVIGGIGLLLLLIACAMYSYSKLKGKSLLPTTGNKFQAFQDALPEGKPYNDPEWDAPVQVELGATAGPKLAPLSSMPQPRQ